MSHLREMNRAPGGPQPPKVLFISYDALKKKPQKLRPRRPEIPGVLQWTITKAAPAVQVPRLASKMPSVQISQHLEQSSDDDDHQIAARCPLPIGQERRKKPDRKQLAFAARSIVESRSTAVTTILQKGNSDPFNAISIPVDAGVNGIITFYRDFVIPAMYSLDSKSWVTSAAAIKDWSEVTDGLRDSCFAYSFLARYATVGGMISPETALSKQAVVYRTRSTTLMRTKIADKKLLHTPETAFAVHGLFGAEVLARNLAGATVHGKMLRFLFEETSKTGKVDLRALNVVLYNIIHLAAMFLSRPLFDLDKWTPEVFAPSWEAAASLLPSLSAAYTDFLDPSIESNALRAIFVMRREGMIVWLRSAPGKPDGSPLIMNWLFSHALIGQGRIINHYLDVMEQLNNSDEALFDSLCAQAYLSLAALYWSRAVSTNPVVCGVPLYDAEPNILAHLRAALAKSETSFDHIQSLKYANARLWALYIGASGEQARASSDFDPSRGWFNSRLAKQAKTLGLLSWQQLREVLQGFLFTDHLRPHGSQWFFKTMSATLDS